MAARLLVEQTGSSLILTLSNPEYRNALAPEMYEAFLPALNTASLDRNIRTVVLTGAQGTFCAGGNLNRLRENRAKPRSVQEESIDQLHAMTRALVTCPKPVIAAVEGAAAGAGLSMALGCDFIVAGRSAKFVMAYVRVGLSPDGGGSWQAVRALPRQIAAEMLLDGQPFSAERLHTLGVVNRVVDDGSALESALAWAKSLEAVSPHAISRIKQLISHAQDAPLMVHLDAERASFVDCLHHADAGEAIDAFLAKRKPRFE